MSNYFSYLPNVYVRLDSIRKQGVDPYVQAKNLFRRIKIRDDLSGALLGFQQYSVQGNERPDNVAEKANVNIDDIKKIFIHQANMKMDDAIVKRLYRLYNKEIPKNILPMNIQSLGNSSVATIPTLFDQVLKGKIMNHKLNKNDLIVFASVGAGMNVNAMVYKI